MLTSVTLANYRSFGLEQTVPLQPITVLVGPNNSGKTTFLEFFGAAGSLLVAGQNSALPLAIHRPPHGDGFLRLGFSSCDASYLVVLGADHSVVTDVFSRGSQPLWELLNGRLVVRGREKGPESHHAIAWPRLLRTVGEDAGAVQTLFDPVIRSRLVRLERSRLRMDSHAVANPVLGPDGSDLASVIVNWRSLDDERFQQLDEFVSGCAPEVAKVIARQPENGKNRLVVRQKDGQQFDASEVSDGLLHLIGLAAHAVSVEKNGILLIEEPEAAIHPRRLTRYVELLKLIVERTGCQIVLATHSPVLVRAFKDEPESIVHFSRGPHGTMVRPLVDMPNAMEQLRNADADPGELLTGGFLTEEAKALAS